MQKDCKYISGLQEEQQHHLSPKKEEGWRTRKILLLLTVPSTRLDPRPSRWPKRNFLLPAEEPGLNLSLQTFCWRLLLALWIASYLSMIFTVKETKCQLMPLQQPLGGRLSPEVTSTQQEQNPVSSNARVLKWGSPANKLSINTPECGCGVIPLWCRASRGRWRVWKGEDLGEKSWGLVCTVIVRQEVYKTARIVHCFKDTTRL